jgi:hypothetical protein
MGYYITEHLLKAVKLEAMYRSSCDSHTESRHDWASDLGYDLAQATDNVWCNGYCQD